MSELLKGIRTAIFQPSELHQKYMMPYHLEVIGQKLLVVCDGTIPNGPQLPKFLRYKIVGAPSYRKEPEIIGKFVGDFDLKFIDEEDKIKSFGGILMDDNTNCKLVWWVPFKCSDELAQLVTSDTSLGTEVNKILHDYGKLFEDYMTEKKKVDRISRICENTMET